MSVSIIVNLVTNVAIVTRGHMDIAVTIVIYSHHCRYSDSAHIAGHVRWVDGWTDGLKTSLTRSTSSTKDSCDQTPPSFLPESPSFISAPLMQQMLHRLTLPHFINRPPIDRCRHPSSPVRCPLHSKEMSNPYCKHSHTKGLSPTCRNFLLFNRLS